MSKKSAIVASTHAHGRACIKWFRLSPSQYETVIYGQFLDKNFSSAVLVYPTAGVEDMEADWVKNVLVPRVEGQISTIGFPTESPMEPNRAAA